MTGILNALIAGVSGAVKDAYFNLVSLLLPGNGTNGAQNNSFLDTGNPAEFTATIAATTMTVSAVASGTIKVGMGITGTGVTAGTTVTAFVTGSGGAGTYTVSSSQTVSVATTMTSTGFPITRNGNTTQGTFSPFSQTGWGNRFDGTSGQLAFPTGSFVFGSSDFTIEAWVYNTGTTTGTFFNGQYTSGATTTSIIGAIGSLNGNFDMYIGSSVYSLTGINPALNQWVHLAIVRTGGTVSVFQNGTRTHTRSDLGTLSINTGGTAVAPQFGNGVNGNISNYRIIIGSGGYDATQSTITVPVAPLTATANTKLLTAQSNRFVDNNASPKTITVTGTPAITPFSPFAPTQSYSAAAVGGSGYFDGTGDYLVASDAALAFNNDDFTLECWVNASSTPSDKGIFESRPVGTGTTGFTVTAFTGTTIRIFSGSALITSGTINYVNTWCHIALSRISGTTTFYVNGQSQGSTGSLGNLTGSSFVIAGGRYGGSATPDAFFPGYISNFRIVKGVGVYTGNFTPPVGQLATSGAASAAAYPSTTNVNTSFASSACSLLLNFTNAGVVDATAKNVLETVGDAQISTTQSKWGGGSIFFNPSAGSATDYLLSATPLSELAFLNNGSPWTVEGWFYTGSTSAQTILSTNAASATVGINIGINSTAAGDIVCGIYRGVSGSSLTAASSGSAWSTNTWVYFAVVLDASKNLKIYIHGSQVATTSGSSFSFSSSNPTYPLVIGRYQFSTPGEYFNGYIDDLRITRGVARTITASPTAPFPVQ